MYILGPTRKVSITQQFLLISLLLLAVTMGSTFILAYGVAKHQVLDMGDELLRSKLKDTVGFIDALNQQVEEGDMTLKEAQETARTYLLGPKEANGTRDLSKSKMSGGNPMYVWAIRPDGTLAMHRSNFEGKNVWDLTIHGKYIVRDTWTLPDNRERVFRGTWEDSDGSAYTAIAYQEYYAPWDWIVGAGGREEAIATERLNSMKFTFSLIMGGIFFAAFFLILLFCRRIIYKLNTINEGLNEVSRGNLSQTIHFKLQDEFGVLACSFNNMVNNLRGALADSPSIRSIFSESEQFLHKLSESESRVNRLVRFKLLKAQEEERKRLARDLHDGVGQVLYSVVIALRLVNKKGNLSNASVQKYLQDVEVTATRSIHDFKMILNELRPASLEKRGLVVAIQASISAFQSKWNIEVDFEDRTRRKRYAPEIEIALYRVFQEALINAGKYSGSDKVTIRLRELPGLLELTVEDYGVGFDVSEESSGEDRLGFGLYGMKERVQLLEGSFRLESELGMGTKIQVAFPIPSDESNFLREFP
jgi:signal transduction histidine kinase